MSALDDHSRRATAADVRQRAAGEISVADDLTFAIVDLGPLNDFTGFLLRIAQLQHFNAFFERFGARELKPGQIAALAAVERNPGIRQGVLANALMIKRSNMAKMVSALEKRGLIARAAPADDKRAVELRLTPRGRTLVRNVLPEMLDLDQRSTVMLDKKERKLLLELLRKMTRPIDDRRQRKDA